MMKKKKHEPEEAPRDLGFGVSVSKQHTRMINPDGSYNIVRKGLNPLQGFSIYHRLISMSWTRFNLMVIIVFILVNIFFASMYLIIGEKHLGGMLANNFTEKFWESFFFSAQTLTTVGYGRVNPIGISASSIAAVESLLGLLGFALATGLLYGRFSRPVAKIIYSRHSIIAPYKDMNGWMFRIANERENQLIEVEVQVVLSMIVEENGKEIRRFFGLELERAKVNFFPTTWTIVHPINEKSPLTGMSEESVRKAGPEFLIMIKAFDDIFSTTVHARYSYTAAQLQWGEKFVNIHEFSKEGASIIHLNRIDDREPAKLNLAVDDINKPQQANL